MHVGVAYERTEDKPPNILRNTCISGFDSEYLCDASISRMFVLIIGANAKDLRKVFDMDGTFAAAIKALNGKRLAL